MTGLAEWKVKVEGTSESLKRSISLTYTSADMMIPFSPPSVLSTWMCFKEGEKAYFSCFLGKATFDFAGVSLSVKEWTHVTMPAVSTDADPES